MNSSLLLGISALAAATLTGCGHRKDDPVGSQSSALASLQGDPVSANEHFLVLVSYENGAFTAEKVTRVPGPLREPRGGHHHGGLRYVARAGASARPLGGAPDPRQVRVEFVDPSTGQMRREEHPAPGKQHMLVHVPASTDAIDFYDAAAFDGAAAAAGQARAAAAPPNAPLGSVSLKGLL